MPITNENAFIEIWKTEVSRKINGKEMNDWRNRDFELLEELIFKETGVSISVSTLKRIWKNAPDRTPHVTTLNALVQFLGYESWYTFKEQHRKDLLSFHSQPAKKANFRKKFRISFVVIFILGSLGTGIALLIDKADHEKLPLNQVNKEHVVFTSKKTVTSGLPNTVVFNYDISQFDIDSAFIQQDWDASKRKRISTEDNTATSIYYYPGHFHAKLVANNTILKEHTIFVTTPDWTPLYKKEYMQDIPVYLENINPRKKGKLHISVEDLQRNKIENDKDYFIAFYHYKDFGEVYGENLRFETSIKNSLADGGLTCQHSLLQIECESGMIAASFCDKGCTSEAFLWFGNVYRGGGNNDLSGLGTDLSEWKNITIYIADKQATIFIEDDLVYELTFSQAMGKVRGICYQFYGCGSVKYARLYNGNDKMMWEDSF